MLQNLLTEAWNRLAGDRGQQMEHLTAEETAVAPASDPLAGEQALSCPEEAVPCDRD